MSLELDYGALMRLGEQFNKPQKQYDRIAIVVANARDRERIQKELDPDRERFMILSPNQIVAGFRFNTVIVTDAAQRLAFQKGRVSRDRFEEWVERDLRRHLIEGGRLVGL